MATKEEIAKGSQTQLWREFPWWLLIIIGFLVSVGYLLFNGEEYNQAFVFIRRGIAITLFTTLVAFLIAMMIGLLAGLGRISSNLLIRNLAITYVEFIRGVPTLVLIFTLAFVIVPLVTDAIQPYLPELPVSEQTGETLICVPGTALCVGWPEKVLIFGNEITGMNGRAIAALAIIYGAFLAEIFRAGIESIPRGQMEAARSLGMTYRQAMRHIILPQAIRNILPALGNDFIAMLKDSSLVSVLAVRDITQQARLYAGSSFRFRETYLVLTFLYLTMTIALSLLLRWYEGRIRQDAK